MKSIYASASLTVFALSFVAGCGSAASVVGGRCRDGMVLEGDTCVTPATPDVTLITPHDPPMGAQGSTDNTGSTGSNLGAQPTPTRPPPPSFVVDPLSNPFQTDPNADPPTHLEPPGPPPPPPPLTCDAPLVECRGACIPVDSDPLNCGSCGHVCRSNICVAGECQGATPGDVVLIGHDYTNAWSGSSQAKVLVNALTIPLSDPIRILSYEDGAAADAVAQAKALAAAGIYGREVDFTVADSANALASGSLSNQYDIVLVHGAGPGDAATKGGNWASALGTFTMKGGVVVALDNGLTPMPQLLTSSGLLAVTGHTLLSDGTHLAVTGAADVVGAQLLSPYAGFGAPITFQGVASPSVDFDWVVRATDGGGSLGDPVVIHRIVRDVP